MVQTGVAEKTSMEMTGHVTRSIFDRYTIVDESDKTEALRKTHARVAPRATYGRGSLTGARPASIDRPGTGDQSVDSASSASFRSG